VTGLVGLPIANLNLRIEFQRGRLHQPVTGAGGQRTTYEQWVIVSLHGDEFVACETLGGDIPRVFALAGTSTDLEPTALAQRVEGETTVAPDYRAGLSDDVARIGRDVAREEFAKRSFAYEADSGAVGLVEHGQPGLTREVTHLGLVELAERKHDARKMFARDRVQEVGLVLVRIARLEQQRTFGALFEASVMSGGESARAKPRGVVEADPEFYFPVTQHVRVRRAPGAIFGEEVIEDALAILLGEAHAMQRDIELVRGRARILKILRAGTVGIVVFPVAHIEPVHVESGAFQQQRRNRGVDSAGHADDDSFGPL
jgi:hypothetical protein